MSTGFRDGNDNWKPKCPCCGRFPNEDDGFYMRTAEEPDFVSLFCNEACARRYELKGGTFVDEYGRPEKQNWETAQ